MVIVGFKCHVCILVYVKTSSFTISERTPIVGCTPYAYVKHEYYTVKHREISDYPMFISPVRGDFFRRTNHSTTVFFFFFTSGRVLSRSGIQMHKWCTYYIGGVSFIH